MGVYSALNIDGFMNLRRLRLRGISRRHSEEETEMVLAALRSTLHSWRPSSASISLRLHISAVPVGYGQSSRGSKGVLNKCGTRDAFILFMRNIARIVGSECTSKRSIPSHVSIR